MRLLRSRPFLVGAALWVLVAAPMVIALVKLSHTAWYPLVDMAQTDMRVRAVGSSHPPLIGLPGRIGPPGNIGSHPGPLSFWLLWPFYELFGGSGWALFAASFGLHLIALAGALWLANRRGGVWLTAGVGAAVLVLAGSLGMTVLMQPWNPYLPLLAWIVVLLTAWSVLCGDVVLLPLLAFAGSFCMQTHLPYLGLGGGLIGLTLVVLAVRLLRGWSDAAARKRVLTWVGVGLAVGAVLWTPPLIDQLAHKPGNLRLIYNDLAHPRQKAGGLHQGVDLLLVHLNPWSVVAHHAASTQSWATVAPGAVFGVVWLASVALALRWRHRDLLALHAVLAAALLLGFFSMSKIYGPLYTYLTLWAWGTCTLIAVAVVWTGVELVRRSRDEAGGPFLPLVGRSAAAVVAVAALASSVMLGRAGARAQVPNPRLNRELAAVAPPTVRALADGHVPGDRGHGRYLVTWADPLALGSQGWGLLDALDRAGYSVGVTAVFRGAVPPEQIVKPSEARAMVHLAVGDADIGAWRAKVGVREVVEVDIRTPAERARYAQLHDRVVADLRAAHLTDLLPAVDHNVVFAALDERAPHADQQMLSEMVDIGLPLAVFVGPGSSLPD